MEENPRVTSSAAATAPVASGAATKSLESTAQLLARVRLGDPAARDHLVARFLPAFRRWAHAWTSATARCAALPGTGCP